MLRFIKKYRLYINILILLYNFLNIININLIGQGSGSRSTAAKAEKRCLQSGGSDGTKSKAARQAGQRAL
jgi:hypothetical protein